MADAAARDNIVAYFEDRIATLSSSLAAGDIDAGDFQLSMREDLRDAFALQLAAGNGGALENTDDYLQLGPQLRTQYRYLEAFSRAIQNNELSDSEIAARSLLYVRASRVMYWLQATNGLDLPGQPGVDTDCLSNCKCEWRIEYNEDGSVDAYWERYAKDSCDTCLQREQDWYPYTIPAQEVT